MHGKYDLVKVDYSTNEPEEAEEPQEKKKRQEPEVASRLSLAIQELLKLIADVRMMKEGIIEMSYDTTKAPLGEILSFSPLSCNFSQANSRLNRSKMATRR